jgi:hypothetical protein
MKKIYTLSLLFTLLNFSFKMYAVNAYTIGQINQTNSTTGVADSLNNRYQLTGTVYGGNLAASGKLSFFINDGTGAIQVYSSHTYGYTPVEGDSIIVVGSLTQYGGVANCGQLEIKPSPSTAGDTIYIVGTGSLVAPEVVTTLDEAHESHLLRLNGLTMSFPTDWTNSASGFSVRTTQNIKLYINKYTNAISVPSPGTSAFDIIGMESQYDTSAPYTQYYSLSPRYASDIITYNGINEVNSNPLRAIVFPNPSAQTINVSFMSNTASTGEAEITNIAGQHVTTETLHVTEGENRKAFNVAQLASGLYFMKIKAGNEESVLRFSVQH